jgi:hypothetical protein
MILWSGQFLGWEVNCINKLAFLTSHQVCGRIGRLNELAFLET